MMEYIPYSSVEMKDGFWHSKQKLNREVTIFAVLEQFQKTGRFDALQCNWKPGMPNKPHIFWDSDIAKWVESAAYILQKGPDERLESICEWVIDQIEKNRTSEGYFNSFYLTVEPQGRWQGRGNHELYCAGHWIEAAVAYYEATGRDRFLHMMEEFARYIQQVFVKEQSASFVTPGHEEIELALYKLYRCTGKTEYRDLSKFFLDNRGVRPREPEAMGIQSHLPVREQKSAKGHAVRAMYLYSAMADIARDCCDQKMQEACEALFQDIVRHKLYITGGIGSSKHGEAFTIPYDLPNKEAYTETCAAIGLIFFSSRLLLSQVDSIYGDVVEQVLYNGFLSGLSLDGKAFFYTNPLELCPEWLEKDVDKPKEDQPWLPWLTQRVKVFGCSCCPPNVTRLLASLGGYQYTYEGDALWVHQYMDSEAVHGGMRIRQETQYPNDGRISITVDGVGRLAFRIPGWCSAYKIFLDGQPWEGEEKRGYVYLRLPPGRHNLELQLDMPCVLVEAHPRVREDAGRVAVRRGPVVYCVESVDNGPMVSEIMLDGKAFWEAEYEETYGMHILHTKGLRRNPDGFGDCLYREMVEDRLPVEITMVPYYAFANRGVSEMQVWLLRA